MVLPGYRSFRRLCCGRIGARSGDCQDHKPVPPSTAAFRGSPIITTSSVRCRARPPFRFDVGEGQDGADRCGRRRRAGQPDRLARRAAPPPSRCHRSHPIGRRSTDTHRPTGARRVKAGRGFARGRRTAPLSSLDEPHHVGFRQRHLIGQLARTLERLFHAHGVHGKGAIVGDAMASPAAQSAS